MSQQIQRGQDFALGDQVTAVKLQDIADKALLLKGAVSTQASVTTAKSGSYTYTSGVTLSVSSTAHGLSTGHKIRATFSETSGGLGSQFSGAKVVTVGSPDSFTITVAGTETASAGTVSYYTLVAEGDEVLINDVSDTGVLYPKKTTVTEILKSEQDVEFKNVNASQNLAVKANAQVDGTSTLKGKVTFDNTSAMRLPVGTTAERPVTPAIGDVRFNSTTLKSEVWNGVKWKVGSGSPFEASGGDYIIGPDETLVSATFYSATGNSGKIIKIVKVGHNLQVGQGISFTSSVTGYEEIEGFVSFVETADLFWVSRSNYVTATEFTTPAACVYRRSGTSNIHIFNGNGTFTVGDEDIYAEILIIGGGGGSYASGSKNNAGGAGGCVHLTNHKLTKNTSYSVTVGNGGSVAGNGFLSSFNNVSANGGSRGSSTLYGGDAGSTSLSNYGSDITRGSNLTNTNNSPHGCGWNSKSTSTMQGIGYSTSITGAPRDFAWGGFSMSSSSYPDVPSDAFVSTAGSGNAKANTGCGAWVWDASGTKTTGTGGSGIVIIKYPLIVTL